MSYTKRKVQNQVPKFIIYIGKLLEFISPKLSAYFAKYLFIKPIKYKIPKREIEMLSNSQQYDQPIKTINKKIRIYKYGNGAKKALLVHGWSGRGTQLVKIANHLIKNNYTTFSFDAPAHGKSEGKTTTLLDFIKCIIEIEQKYGPFEIAVGHSLGSMAILNAINQGVKFKKIVIIGSGNSIYEIVKSFIKKLHLSTKTCRNMIQLFEKNNVSMEAFSPYTFSNKITTPVLIIHDKDDDDVPFTASKEIHKKLINSQLIITNQLGHRKILGETNTIENIISFIKE